jgi:subtilisin family serine protease
LATKSLYVFAVAVVLLATAPAGTAHADPGAGKVAPQVRAETAHGHRSTFWVQLDGQADLGAAAHLRDKTEKRAYVYHALSSYAARSQAGLLDLLSRRKATVTPYWIANTVKVTGDADVVRDVAARPEVAAVLPDRTYHLDAPRPDAARAATADGPEWNLAAIHAPQVWNEFGVRGEGVVVASIDTGVQYDHPALAARYRGRHSDGTVDHNYNWFDPSQVCPSAAPCDNVGHGTHTMGTMVGEDGWSNQIGVAPGARWITAKGCESYACSQSALLASGQWILAPTDLAGRHPRPDLAPDVVNNSWGAGIYDPWYRQTVRAWIGAGIFPAFANGNAGPQCATAGSPGSYADSYSSGAYDRTGTIASFSSRGTGENGVVKPDIAAPGVDVRSSLPGGGYGSLSGTSMASPHTAATVALLWSAAPALDGDVAATRRLLDSTAVPVADLSCGGTAAFNDVYGHGRLDAYAAVRAAPRSAVGGLTGNVTTDGWPVPDASVAVDGPLHRMTSTAPDGQYRFERLVAGTYTVTVTKFGFVTVTGSATVTPNGTATLVVDLHRAPSAVLSGTVRARSGPVAGATVAVLDTPLTARTDSTGRYRIVMPKGDYDVAAQAPEPCLTPASAHLSLAADTTIDLFLPDRTDHFGHSCTSSRGAPYVGGTTRLDLTGDDVVTQVALPFPVTFYGGTYTTAWVASNGFVSFAGPAYSFVNATIPDSAEPNAALYPFWDDLVVDDQAGVYTAPVGDAPHRGFVVEWRNVLFFGDTSGQRITFSAEIDEDGTVTYRYGAGTGSGRGAGDSATIGTENADGTDALQYSYNLPVVSADLTVTVRPPTR